MAGNESDRPGQSAAYERQVTRNIGVLRRLFRNLGPDTDLDTLLSKYRKATGLPAGEVKLPRRRS